MRAGGCHSRLKTPTVCPSPGEDSLSPVPTPLPTSPLRRTQGQHGSSPHPLVDVLVDCVRALIEGALEEQGAHRDGKGESGSPAEKQGIQLRSKRRGRHVSSQPNLSHRACAEADLVLQSPPRAMFSGICSSYE